MKKFNVGDRVKLKNFDPSDSKYDRYNFTSDFIEFYKKGRKGTITHIDTEDPVLAYCVTFDKYFPCSKFNTQWFSAKLLKHICEPVEEIKLPLLSFKGENIKSQITLDFQRGINDSITVIAVDECGNKISAGCLISFLNDGTLSGHSCINESLNFKFTDSYSIAER